MRELQLSSVIITLYTLRIFYFKSYFRKN